MRDGEAARSGQKLVAEDRKRFDRQILELVGDDVALLAEAAKRFDIVEGGAGEPGGDFGGAGRLVGIEDVALVAEPGRGHGHHPAKLAAADDADGGAWRKRHSGFSGTASVCFARHSASRWPSASS